jgi:hypothetical protein
MKVLNETANCSYAFRNVTVVNLKSVLWDLVFIIYKYRYYTGSFFSCLKDKRPADVRLAFQISVGLIVDEKSEKKNTCDNNLLKVYQKPAVLEQMPKMWHSKTNALRFTAEDVVCSRQYLPAISVLSETNGFKLAIWYPLPYFLTPFSCLQSC